MLTGVKAVDMGLALELKRVCEELGLRCLLAYGSLLGAARHKGFIPWDDDMDFVMPRPDYERFLTEAPAILGKEFELHSCRNGDKYLFFAQLEDSRTIFYESMNRYTRYYWKGIHIDIFPIDGVPDDEKAAEKFVKRVNRISHAVTMSVISLEFKPNLSLWKKIALKILHLRNTRALVEKRERLLRKYDFVRAKRVFVCSEPQIFDKVLFEETALYEFEGETFYGMKNYEALLSIQYGDWRTPPPQAKRVTAHDYDKLDAEHSYLEDGDYLTWKQKHCK